MRRYNHKVGLVGLLVGVIILAIGFLTHNAQLAGPLAMATILVSTIAAYYYPQPTTPTVPQPPTMSTGAARAREPLERGARRGGDRPMDGLAIRAAARWRPSYASHGLGDGSHRRSGQRAWR
jgi:hypothetical protein